MRVSNYSYVTIELTTCLLMGSLSLSLKLKRVPFTLVKRSALTNKTQYVFNAAGLGERD